MRVREKIKKLKNITIPVNATTATDMVQAWVDVKDVLAKMVELLDGETLYSIARLLIAAASEKTKQPDDKLTVTFTVGQTDLEFEVDFEFVRDLVMELSEEAKKELIKQLGGEVK